MGMRMRKVGVGTRQDRYGYEKGRCGNKTG